MQRHGWTNVAGNAVQHVAYDEFIRAAGFHHQMLLTMRHGRGVRQIEELNAWMRLLGGNRLVPEVQTKTIASGFADDAGQNQRRVDKIKIGTTG